MKIKYVEKRFNLTSIVTINHANKIIEEYQKKGYDLTLRQLYYQFVSRDLIANNMGEYKKLGSIVNDARLAGLISWQAIVDRTRNLLKNPHWDDPKEFMESVCPQFAMDKWAGQKHRVEVWVEKDALIGVVERVATALDVSYFSCRGYTSQSEMWAAAQRLGEYADEHGQTPVIIHLGDHDPSGIDMSRDIADRLELFMGGMKVDRIALNMNQVEKYGPPPNPAKLTDSRATKYIKVYGNESWELDALKPEVLDELIWKTVISYRDDDKWDKAERVEKRHRNKILKLAKTLA